jgi:prolyl-tRNA synthetase
VDTVLDDREGRAGFKFNDADLVGYPVQVVVGEKGMAKGIAEIKSRDGSVREEAPLAEAAKRVPAILRNLGRDQTGV